MIKKHGSENKVKKIFKNHLITEKAYEYMKKDDFDNFIIEREKAIKKHIISILGIK
jgi:ribosomal protein L23